jgi:hypothetical protein
MTPTPESDMAKAEKKERWLSLREIRAQARFDNFRPYHVTRAGKNRMGEYETRHCVQANRAFEAIEDFFHALRMRARGFVFSRGMDGGVHGRWVRYG